MDGKLMQLNTGAASSLWRRSIYASTKDPTGITECVGSAKTQPLLSTHLCFLFRSMNKVYLMK
jgi:hypothetical protein